MRVLIISPSLEEPGSRGLHVITKNIIESLQHTGNATGLLVGLPNHKKFKESKEYDSKITNIYLQHYMNEGRRSFRYVVKGGYSRMNAAMAAFKGDIYRPRFIAIEPETLPGKKTMLNDMQFAIQSPFFYQLLNRNHEKKVRKILQKICSKNKIDLIISTAPSVIYSSWFKRTKVVQFVHDFMPIEVTETPPDNDTPLVFAKQIYAACHGSDLLLANSEDTKAKIIESNPDAKVKVLYGAVQAPRDSGSTILSQRNLKKDGYLVFASALEKRKNIENIMSAYALAKEKIHDMPLVFIGGAGYGFEDIFDAHQSLPDEVRDSIIFTGYLSRADKDALFINARACIFPTIYEGLGLPVVEALAGGTPVLASNVGAMPEAGKDAAFYVQDPYNVEEISAGIISISTDETLRKDLMAKAPKVVDFFSEEQFRKRLSEVITILTEGNK